MDNILKMILAVLGIAGLITFLATTLNTPKSELEKAPVADSPAPSPAPAPSTQEEPAESGGYIVEDEGDYESFGDPMTDLDGDESEAPANDTGDKRKYVDFDAPDYNPDSVLPSQRPPPAGAR